MLLGTEIYLLFLDHLADDSLMIKGREHEHVLCIKHFLNVSWETYKK